VIGGDTLPRKKPDPLPLRHACERFDVEAAQALMVGDSANDVAAARAAGVDVLVLPYGYTEGASVDSLGAVAVVPDFAAAADYVGA
jgi:phosphoglycolate phosphatase